MFGAGVFLIGLSYVDCTQTALAVALLVLAVTLSGFVFSGFFVNHMDIAPQYAGTLMAISSGIATISGLVAPYIAATVTESVSKAVITCKINKGFATFSAFVERPSNKKLFCSV